MNAKTKSQQPVTYHAVTGHMPGAFFNKNVVTRRVSELPKPRFDLIPTKQETEAALAEEWSQLDLSPQCPTFLKNIIQNLHAAPKTEDVQRKKTFGELFFAQHTSWEEEQVRNLEWLVESGALPELSGKLLECYVRDHHITRRNFVLRKALNRYYQNQEACTALEAKAMRELLAKGVHTEELSESDLVYAQCVLKPEDKVAAHKRLDAAPQFDCDDVKQKSKWFNRFRNWAKNFSRVATTYKLIEWLKNLSLPFAVLSMVSNFANMWLDIGAVVIDLKRTYSTRRVKEGWGAWFRGALLENKRLYNIIDSASSWMSSLVTVVLELAFGLLLPSIIVGLCFTAFDLGFTIWGMIYDNRVSNKKVGYLLTQRGLVNAELAVETKKLDALKENRLKRIADLHFTLQILQKQTEKCTNPESRRALLEGQSKVLDKIRELEEKNEECDSELYQELLRHQKNFTGAIEKEKASNRWNRTVCVVNLILFGAILVSVGVMQVSFPAGAIMLLVCATAKTGWKIYQRAREMGGFKAWLTGKRPEPPEALVKERELALINKGERLVLSDANRLKKHTEKAVEVLENKVIQAKLAVDDQPQTSPRSTPSIYTDTSVATPHRFAKLQGAITEAVTRVKDALVQSGLVKADRSPASSPASSPSSVRRHPHTPQKPRRLSTARRESAPSSPSAHPYIDMVLHVGNQDQGPRSDAEAWLYDGFDDDRISMMSRTPTPESFEAEPVSHTPKTRQEVEQFLLDSTPLTVNQG